MVVLVTGGAGYIGRLVVRDLRTAGHEVRVLDSLLHGQEDIGRSLADDGVDLIRGDVRDPAARERALSGADAVVHLAAIVGDPACGRDPELSQAVNVGGTRGLLDDAARLGAQRFVFASTCSNYGRMADPTVPIDEDGELAAVSLYAEQKVAMERLLLGDATQRPDLVPTCLRFATIYGVAPRMRFDLTVNEFTRDLWAARPLEVFGEQFWRPYVHVADAARAVALVLASPPQRVAGRVFNVGHSDENHRKLDLVRIVTGHLGRGEVSYVARDEDPRDYKVEFGRIRDELGFVPEHRVPDGVAEIVAALEQERFGDPFSARFSNIG
ncbi:MAG: NAD(P)-dependent oxidoreductase [Solirubrobacteraceae bacterium MAG38_C4-C5]|nr:NAD(P)-dependent oxidoreductase [Candidatus Siliceabacter maunaloa]